MNSETKTALEIIKLGYAVDDPTDQNRCLIFRVSFDNKEGAMEAIKLIDQYNNFDANVLNPLIETLNFGRYHRIEVGREYSPVIYFGNFYDVKEGDADLIEQIKLAMHEASADEINLVDNGRQLRCWWD